MRLAKPRRKAVEEEAAGQRKIRRASRSASPRAPACPSLDERGGGTASDSMAGTLKTLWRKERGGGAGFIPYAVFATVVVADRLAHSCSSKSSFHSRALLSTEQAKIVSSEIQGKDAQRRSADRQASTRQLGHGGQHIVRRRVAQERRLWLRQRERAVPSK
jgi:hypothetical protein